jgi:hypothetical protein
MILGSRFEISRLPVAQRPPQPTVNGKFTGKAGAGSFLKRSPR